MSHDKLEPHLGRRVWRLAKWPLYEHIGGFCVGMVDTLLSTRLDDSVAEAAADAVGVGAYLGWFMNLLPHAIGIGATALIARSVGARRLAQARTGMGQALLLSFVAGITVLSLMLGLAGPLAKVLGLEGLSFDYSVSYMRICAVAAPLSAIFFVGGACLRGAGDTRTPFRIVMVVNIINLTLSYLFVQAGWRVSGIAWGTAIAWAVGGLAMIWILRRPGYRLHVPWHRFKPHRITLWRILRIGLPQLPESFGMLVANMVLLAIIGMLKQPGVQGAHIIVLRLESAAFLPGFAFGVAASTLVGQSLGRKEPDIAQREATRCWWLSLLFMGPLGLIMVLFPDWLISMVSPSSSLHAEQCPVPLQVTGIAQLIFGVLIVYGAALRGAGDTRFPALTSLVSQMVLRVPLAAILALPTGTMIFGLFPLPWGLGTGLLGIWTAMMVEIWVRSVIFLWRFRAGHWRTAKV